MSSSNCCFLTCIRFLNRQVKWSCYSHLFQNFPQFIVIHTSKGFGMVNKAEMVVFLELSSFFHDSADVGNLISGSSAFSKTSLWLYYLQPKMETLYTVSKNKTGNWLWLRSWSHYCQIETEIEESRENHSEKAMAPHSSTLAWKIPWTEKPGRLQSMRSLRVRHDLATSLSLFTFMHWRRKWQSLQCSCLENTRDRGA